MKKSRFTEEQIIKVLKQAEGGTPTKEVCRQQGISNGTFYKWKAKFGSLKFNLAIVEMRPFHSDRPVQLALDISK